MPLQDGRNRAKLGCRCRSYSVKVSASYQNWMPYGRAMNMNEIKEALLWCVGINYALLLIWFGLFVYAHDWLYRMHTRWFKLSVETFDALTYAGITIYKLGIILLNLVPLVAIYLSS
jgi:hypothetical protein